MCSLRGVKVFTLAAIFCTRCSLRSKLQEPPVNSAFSQSNFHMTKAWIRVLVASCVINRLIRLMLWSRRYAPRHTVSMLSVESYTIPRFCVVASGYIKQPSTVTWMLVANVNLCLVPKVIIFVLFPFNSSRFWRNQESTSSRQCWSSWSAFLWSHGRNEMYSWTSSAYTWKVIRCFLITSPNGEMYIVNNSKQTINQTNKQTNKRTNEQTNKQSVNQASKQATIYFHVIWHIRRSIMPYEYVIIKHYLIKCNEHNYVV